MIHLIPFSAAVAAVERMVLIEKAAAGVPSVAHTPS